ncbi:hypothetical protein CH373_09490 [Leptospira perolatii]|uniref:Uncharacterized protein n=2 Tax=Leptospira perolatii TaxID=2023191 RepID=A0A2M9ZMI6_9LEPT|nr:hypothetical protein CH360_15990 [Leptospira perolatii]PJZ73211.1 hypothetical protein CH373_09490 [Leptospira perolatii]
MPGSYKDFLNSILPPLIFKCRNYYRVGSVSNLKRLIVSTSLLLSANFPLFAQEPSSWASGISRTDKSDSALDVWEFGARFGFGWRGPNRFDQNLDGFSSTLNPSIPNHTNVQKGLGMAQGEIFFRTRISENFKAGFLGGYRLYQNFGLTNITSEPFYTKLEFGMQSIYLLAMVWQHGRVNRWLSWETGLGLGYTSAKWTSKGWATDFKDYFPQEGNLSGSGLEFRLEGALSTKVSDHVSLQLGVLLAWVNITSFDGSFNGDTSSFYVREDGRVTPLTSSANQQNILISQQYSRKLDMQSAYGGLFFGAVYRL